MLLCKKIARALGGHKNLCLLSWGEGGRIDPISKSQFYFKIKLQYIKYKARVIFLKNYPGIKIQKSDTVRY